MKKPVAAYYHTHWDREWYLPFRTYQLRLADVVDEVLLLLERHELPCFTLDGQVAILDDYLELRPENRERLHALIASGRIDIGPWLVMPDEFLVGGESLLRNLAVGITRSKALGCHRFTGYLPDTFGHSADMPLLLQGFGIESAIVWRGIQPSSSVFRWQGPSKAIVTALHLTDGYFQIPLDDWTLTPEQRISALEVLLKKLEAARAADLPVLLPMGGDHMGALPPEGRNALLKHLPDVWETTPASYMQAVSNTIAGKDRKQLADEKIDTVQGELADHQGAFLLPGVYSSRLYLKRENRLLEHELVHRLEPLLAIAKCLSLKTGTANLYRYPSTELGLAWHTLMMNHPHDSICGCSVDEVHRENETRFDQVRQIAACLTDRALETIAFIVPGAKETGWVLNTGDRSFSGVIPTLEFGPPEEVMPQIPVPSPIVANPETQPGHLLAVQMDSIRLDLQDEYRHDPHRIPMAHLTRRCYRGWRWVDNVPPFGIQLISHDQTDGALPSSVTPVQATATSLENGLLKATVQPDGTLVVEELSTGKRSPGLLSFSVQQDQGDSYNAAPVPGDIPIRAAFENSRVKTAGPLVVRLVLTHSLPAPNPLGELEPTCESEVSLTTSITLMAGSNQLVFETRFVNRSLTAHKVQVSFPTGQPVREVVTESHFSCVTRHYEPDYLPQNQMPVASWKELKSNAGPVQRFFSANGHSWLTEGLAEYEVVGDEIRLTLLRAFTALSAVNTGVRGAQAGPPLLTKEGACLDRELVCRYAWLPTPSEPEGLYAAANRFYGQVKAYGPDRRLNGKMASQASPACIADPPNVSSLAHFSMLECDNPAVVASACHWLPRRGLLLRVMNTSAEPASFTLRTGFAYSRLYKVNFLNEPQGHPFPISQETIPSVGLLLAPFDVQTFIFEIENP